MSNLEIHGEKVCLPFRRPWMKCFSVAAVKEFGERSTTTENKHKTYDIAIRHGTGRSCMAAHQWVSRANATMCYNSDLTAPVFSDMKLRKSDSCQKRFEPDFVSRRSQRVSATRAGQNNGPLFAEEHPRDKNKQKSCQFMTLQWAAQLSSISTTR